MKSNHPTDEFVRQKLAQKVPEFNPAHWEAALADLEGQSPGKRGGILRWWLPSLLIVLVSLGMLAWGLFTPKPRHESVQPQATLSQPASPQPSAQPASPTPASNLSNQTKEPGSETEPVKPSAAISTPTPEARQHQSSSEPQTDLTEENSAARQVAGLRDQADRRLRVLAARGASLTRENPSASPYPTAVLVEYATELTTGLDEMSLPAATEHQIGDISLQGVDPSGFFFALHSPLINLQPESPKHRVAQPPRHSLGIMTGLGLARGLGDPGASGLAPGMGIHYGYALSPAFRLEAGLGYTVRGGLAGSQQFQSIRYGFGSEREDVLLDFRQRQMVELPLNLAWRPAGNHYVHLGTNIARQVNVQGELTTIITDPFGKQTQTVVRQGGYRQAYRPYDISLQAGYGYYLGKGIRLDLLGQYGLTDLTPDAFWNQVRMDRNVQLRLQLTYHFLSW